MGNSQLDNLMRRNPLQIPAFKHDSATVRNQTGNRPQDRGLARAIRADQGDDFALQHRERHAMQRPDAIVMHLQIAHFQLQFFKTIRCVTHPTGPSPR